MSDFVEYTEKIRHIVSKFGSNLRYLGSGKEGVVWSIDDIYALKVYRYQIEISSSIIPELEIKIYDQGVFSGKVTWVIKELFDTPNEDIKDFLTEIIIELTFFVENQIENF